MVLDLIRLVEVGVGGFVGLNAGLWGVVDVPRSLTNGPDHMHCRVSDVIVGKAVIGYELPAEDGCGLALPLNGHCRGQTVGPAIHLILPGHGTVSCVVVPYAVGSSTSTNDDDVSAVHGMKVATGWRAKHMGACI